MSRALVLASLRGDSQLNDLVVPQNIITNYSKEGRPDGTNALPFIILRWGEQNALLRGRGPRDLTVWAHYPAEKSTDYSKVDAILSRVEEILLPIADEPGEDGYTITDISPAGGWSPDLFDEGFNTIVRNAAFNVLSHKT